MRTKKAKEIKARWQNWKFNKYTPSIFMPRWASRLTLKVSEINVERLQDIDQTGIMKEGIKMISLGMYWYDERVRVNRENFVNLWDFINGKRGFGWDKNPWVWVVKFKKL